MPSAEPSRSRRRLWLVTSVVAACAAVAAVGGTVRMRESADGRVDAAAGSVATVAVTRTDLTTGRTLRGTLGFGLPRPVRSGREGVVTWLPEPGATIGRGDVLYRLNDEAVPLFTGSPPLYRTLSERNTVGRDVAMVAANLRALGYTVGAQPKVGDVVPQAEPSAGTAPTRVTVKAGDGVLTTALIAAIRKWQRDRSLPEDGRLEVGDLAVLPGPVRVDSVAGLIGDAATGVLMSVTSTTKVVTVQAAADEVDALREGDSATVRLPTGADLPGRIGAIATVAQSGDQGPDGPQTVAVTVTLDDPAAAGSLTGAAVSVEVAGEVRTGVLTVPVTALVALREGGHAVQLEDGRYLPVQTGLFSRGMVEVSGDGIVEGLRVVTAS